MQADFKDLRGVHGKVQLAVPHRDVWRQGLQEKRGKRLEQGPPSNPQSRVAV